MHQDAVSHIQRNEVGKRNRILKRVVVYVRRVFSLMY